MFCWGGLSRQTCIIVLSLLIDGVGGIWSCACQHRVSCLGARMKPAKWNGVILVMYVLEYLIVCET